MGLDFRKFRKVRIQAGVKALALARMAHLSHSRISLWESGTVELSEAQRAKLTDSLLKEIVKRMESFRAAIETLRETEPENKVAADGAGAPGSGQESELRCDERNNAG
jgi:transcriptional regulator with XRE-family HTH domain